MRHWDGQLQSHNPELQNHDLRGETEPDGRGDCGEAETHDGLAARPKVPCAEGEEEEDREKDDRKDEVGQLGEPLLI
jgi:hypothetical protein